MVQQAAGRAPNVFLRLSSVGWGDLDLDLVLSLDQVMAACFLLLRHIT